MGYTSDEVIASIKKRGLIPTSQLTFQTSDFLRFINEEIRINISPMLMAARENFFLKSLEDTLVAGQTNYDIAERAIGMKLKNLYYIGSNSQPYRLNMIDVDEIVDYEVESRTGNPEQFYFLDNQVVVLPTPSSGIVGSLRQYYYERRNEVVSTTDCGLISAINTVTKTVTVNAVPTGFAVGTDCDFVKAKPGFQNLSIDEAITAISSTDLTFAALPSTLQVGDYVCEAQQSPIPQIPIEVFPLLSQRVVIRCLRSLNDKRGADDAKEDLKEMAQSIIELVAVRAEDQAKKIVSYNNILKHILS
jgi:hypothetical protein